MPREIERKFLVADTAWLAGADGTEIVQAYVASTAASIRVRVRGGLAWLTLKSKGAAMSRAEYEYPVPLHDAREMIELFCDGSTVAKRRHEIEVAEARWSVDVFYGRHDGLILAEVELGAEDDAVVRPAWLGREVTGDDRYLNEALADPARPTPPVA